jgi:hypothetical protein
MTKRLSKTECSEIATKMTSGIQSEINKCEKYFGDLARKLLAKKVPKEVTLVFEQSVRGHWFVHTKTNCQLSIGVNRYVWTSFEQVPVSRENLHNTVCIDNASDEKEANIIYDRMDALKNKKKLMKTEIESVLFKLATYKKVSEFFPEALPFLPKVQENQLPQINLDSFREKLKTELSF